MRSRAETHRYTCAVAVYFCTYKANIPSLSWIVILPLSGIRVMPRSAVICTYRPGAGAGPGWPSASRIHITCDSVTSTSKTPLFRGIRGSCIQILRFTLHYIACLYSQPTQMPKSVLSQLETVEHATQRNVHAWTICILRRTNLQAASSIGPSVELSVFVKRPSHSSTGNPHTRP